MLAVPDGGLLLNRDLERMRDIQTGSADKGKISAYNGENTQRVSTNEGATDFPQISSDANCFRFTSTSFRNECN